MELEDNCPQLKGNPRTQVVWCNHTSSKLGLNLNMMVDNEIDHQEVMHACGTNTQIWLWMSLNLQL